MIAGAEEDPTPSTDVKEQTRPVLTDKEGWRGDFQAWLVLRGSQLLRRALLWIYWSISIPCQVVS